MSGSRCSSGIFKYIGNKPDTPEPSLWKPFRRGILHDAEPLPPIGHLLGSPETPEPCLVALPALLSRIEKLRRKYKGLPLPLLDTHLSLLSLPLEILQTVFRYTAPEDLASLSISCSTLNHYIQRDPLLWKQVYLKTYAYPKQEMLVSGFDWKLWAQKLYRTWSILWSKDDNLKWNNLESIAESICHLLQADSTTDPSTSHVQLLDVHFSDGPDYNTLLCQSALHQWARTESLSKAGGTVEEGEQTPYPASSPKSQLSAKLHCLAGGLYYFDQDPWTSFVPGLKMIAACAASRVYDWRQWGRFYGFSRWGPFVDNHTLGVDWEKMEAIQCVLAAGCQRFVETILSPDDDNGRILTTAWEDPFAGAAPGSFVTPVPRKVTSPLDARDPYNVTGTWIRILCCPDNRQLLAFNNPPVELLESQPRPPRQWREKFALMSMQLRVTHVEPMYARGFGALPVVHFEGTRTCLANTEAHHPNGKSRGKAEIIRTRQMKLKIRYLGTVSLTAEGEVWWTSFETGQGAEPWECQGIQVGGLDSARGVFGMWMRRDSRRGAVELGPTAFRKEKD